MTSDDQIAEWAMTAEDQVAKWMAEWRAKNPSPHDKKRPGGEDSEKCDYRACAWRAGYCRRCD